MTASSCISFTSSGPIQSTLLSMILPGGGAVLADLSPVTFLDSSGLGVLVQAHSTAVERSTRLVVVASPPVRKLPRPQMRRRACPPTWRSC